MRIKTNFSAPIERWVMYITTSFCVVSTSMLLLTFWMLIDHSEMQIKIKVLKIETTALKQKSPAEIVQSGTPAIDWKTARKRLEAVAKVAEPGNTTPTISLRKLEELLPDTVYLVSLHYKKKNGEFLIISESPQKSALTKFLYNLEKEKRFTDILLAKQELFNSKGVEITRYELRFRERPL